MTYRTAQSPGPWYVLEVDEGIVGGPYETKSDALWLHFQTTRGCRRIHAGFYELREGGDSDLPANSYFVATEEGARRQGFGWRFDERSTSATTSATMRP